MSDELEMLRSQVDAMRGELIHHAGAWKSLSIVLIYGFNSDPRKGEIARLNSERAEAASLGPEALEAWHVAQESGDSRAED